MPHRVSLSKQAANCMHRVAELQRQLEELQLDNRYMRFAYRLLSEYYGVLVWQQEQLLGCWPTADGDSTLASCFAGTTAEELMLMARLQSDLINEQLDSPTSHSAPTGSRSSWTTLQLVQSASSNNPARPLAPAADPLWVMREVCSRPPHPEASSMTLQQLRGRYTNTVQRLSLLFNMLDHPHSMMHCILHPTEEMLGLILDHLSLVYTLWGPCDKGDLVVGLCWSNCITGKSYAPYPCKEVYMHVLKRLRLSADQQERIAWGHQVYDNLLKPIMQERKQLQQQLAAEGASTAEDLFASAVLPAGMRQPGAADLQQHRHQQVLQRLQVVMKKALLLEVCMAGHTLGCLSLKQQCQMFVDAYPVALSVTRFSSYVAELQQQTSTGDAKRQQQEQQHQQLLSRTLASSHSGC